jgi:hypothetical protein
MSCLVECSSVTVGSKPIHRGARCCSWAHRRKSESSLECSNVRSAAAAVTSLGRGAEQALEGLPVSLFCVRPMTAPSCLQEGVWQNRPGGNTVQGLERYQVLAAACAPDGERALTSAARSSCRCSPSENVQSSVQRKGCISYHRTLFLHMASGLSLVYFN